jgi:L-erythro-3,5-diaminohexanoate dehydrogenase
MSESFRPSDALGIQRSLTPKGVLPQQAEVVDASLPIAEDELLIEVESLNIDSASFRQISEACGADSTSIKTHILELVARRGKHHNPVTGSGGMLIGRVSQVGPGFPVEDKPVRVGDRIAALVSLTLTPLQIRKLIAIHPDCGRVDIEGHAILFASGLFARLPTDIPESVALAALDVAGAPAQVRRIVKPGNVVVVVGGGGKAGVLCLYEAKRHAGVKTVAIDFTHEAVERLSSLPFVDEVIQVDARNSLEVMDKVWTATRGHMGDIVINTANVPETEIASILAARARGIVYFYSMATSFTRAALGAEGVGADVDLRIGNGYAEGHAELTLDLLRESPALMRFFVGNYS